MPSISCDIAGQHKARDTARVLAEARRERADGSPYKGMDGRTIDPARSHLNLHYRSPRWEEWDGDPRTACALLDSQGRQELLAEGKTLKGRQPLKEGSVIMRGIIIQASPEAFFPDMTTWSETEKQSAALYGKRGQLDMEAVKSFWKTTITALKEKYGDYLLEAHLHLDEASPHIHAEILPYNETKKAISNNSLFPGKQSVRDFHTWLHDRIGKPLGLARSREGEKRDPIRPHYEAPPALLERQLAEREAAVMALEKKAETDTAYLETLPQELVLPRPIEPERPEKTGLFASEAEKTAYKNALENYEAEIKQYEHKSDPKWRSEEQSRIIIEHLNNNITTHNIQANKIKELQSELKQTKKELEYMRQEIKRQEAAQLKSIPIIDIIERMYSDILYQDRDKSIWKSSDGRKIGITGQLFIDNHDSNFKGKGAIDFVMHMENLSVKEAIGKLKDYFSSAEVLQHIATTEPHRLTPIIDSQPSQPEPPAPATDDSKTPALKTWMTKELKISATTADFLLESGQVYADSHANCCIPRPGGGAFMRGTVTLKSGQKNTFKRTSGSKRAGTAVLKGSSSSPRAPVILCEGVTDGLALVDRYPAALIVITGGSLYPDLPPLPEHPEQQVLLAFDRDEAGEAHTAHYGELFPQAERLLPPDGCKDWSEAHQHLQRKAHLQEITEQLAHTPSPKPH